MQRVWELDADTAAKAMHAAEQHARHLGAQVSVAVVDGAGILKAFARMDGASVGSAGLALGKAYTAACHRIDTATVSQLAEAGGPLFGLFATDAGRCVVFAGGLPIWADGAVIGGVGVSGADTSQDMACAEAALAIAMAAIEAHGAHAGGPGAHFVVRTS